MTTSDFPSLAGQQQFWDTKWTRAKTPSEYMLCRGEALLAILRSLPLDHPKILDLGCGTGWFTERLSHLGEVMGIDLSEAGIAMAKSEFPHIRFIAQNLFDVPLPAEHFDVVVSQEVIAHVQDQVGYLDRIVAALKPNGYLLITTANKFMMERINWPQQPPEHIEQWLNMRGFKRLLRPRFRVLQAMSIMPVGNRGVYRLINSRRLNTALEWMIPHRRLEALKEWAGLGYTLIALAQKKF